MKYIRLFDTVEEYNDFIMNSQVTVLGCYGNVAGYISERIIPTKIVCVYRTGAKVHLFGEYGANFYESGTYQIGVPFPKVYVDGEFMKLTKDMAVTDLTDGSVSYIGATKIPDFAFCIMDKDGFPVVSEDESGMPTGDLKSVVIPEGVTSIGMGAFAFSVSLESVTIPNTVTTIDMAAFVDCVRLKSVSIPGSVEVLQEGVFFECISLEDVVIGHGVKDIRANSFDSCYSLKSVELADTIEYIGDFAFVETSLTKIVMPDSVTEVGYAVFGGCKYLENVILSNKLERIEAGMFSGCESLKSIIIPGSVTSIGEFAFDGCTSLKEIYIYGCEVTFDDDALVNCGLEKLYVPADCLDYYSRLFPVQAEAGALLPIEQYADEILYTTTDSKTCVSANADLYGVSIIENEYTESGGCMVFDSFLTDVPNNLFAGCTTLTSVTFTSYVDTIGNYSFNACENLEHVSLGGNIAIVGECAFAGCSSIAQLTLPGTVTEIGANAFSGCSGLEAININSVTPPSIESGAFDNTNDCPIYVPNVSVEAYKSAWSAYADRINADIPANELWYTTTDGAVCSVDSDSITSNTYENGMGVITFNQDLTEVPSELFYNRGTLESVIIPDSVVSIGDSAFFYCSSLTGIIIPDSVTSIGDSAFCYCSSLTDITIPGSVTSIGDSAFNGCSSLKDITIPDGVTSIGDSAFRECTSLTNITIPDGVTSIGDSAFIYCSSLTDITIPDSVVSIDYHAFNGCSALMNITIPDSVTSIGEYAFYDCSSLTNITIPDSVTSIGNSAFSGCSSLNFIRLLSINPPTLGYGTLYNTNECPIYVPSASVDAYKSAYRWSEFSERIVGAPANELWYTTTDGAVCGAQLDSITSNIYENGFGVMTFNQDLTEVPSYLFDGCVTLESVIIPDGVTSIGDSAFNGCSLLKGITIPDGVTSIGDSAFNGCSLLKGITIPDGVTSIGNGAFNGCSSLNYITCQSEVPSSIGTSSFDNTNDCPIYVPSVSVGAYRSAWSQYADRIYVDIPANELWYTTTDGTVYSVDSDSITSNIYENGKGVMTFNQDLTEIPRSMFYNRFTTSTLYSVIIPYGVASIGNAAFLNCTSLTEITIPDSVSTIEGRAFEGCSSLTDITIPDSVTSIESETFLNCSSLTDITIPDGVAYIGYKAFQGCSSLTDIKIPDSVTSIESETFLNCSSLTDITIPDGVAYIGYKAFQGCSSLTDIKIPGSVTSIGNNAFETCTSLTEITIPDSVSTIEGRAFEGCSSLTDITIPDSVTSIESETFLNCSSLTDITIPDGVTHIEYGAFYGCSSLTYIIIPDSVTEIRSRAFYDCSSLNFIRLLSIKPPTLDNETLYNTNDCPIYVPNASVEAYKSAYRWSEYSERIVGAPANELWYTTTDGAVCSVDSDAITINTYEKGFGVITFNQDLTEVPSYLFDGCVTLESVIIPDGMASIGDNAFQGCPSLTEIAIPYGMTSIGYGAFRSCPSITDIKIPGSVTSIGNNAFETCTSLTEIAIPDSVTSIGNNAFENCTSLTEIAIPDSVTTIGDSSFQGCTSLKEITISDGVSSIGNGAFNGCSALMNITIPGSVASIGDSAFQGCSSLNYITCQSEVPTSIGVSAFDNTNDCPIYVPNAFEDAYKSAWSAYADRIGLNTYYDEYLTFTRVDMDEEATLMFNISRYGTLTYKMTDNINESSAGVEEDYWDSLSDDKHNLTVTDDYVKLFVGPSYLDSITGVENLELSGNATKSLGDNAENVLAAIPDDLKKYVMY